MKFLASVSIAFSFCSAVAVFVPLRARGEEPPAPLPPPPALQGDVEKLKTGYFDELKKLNDQQNDMLAGLPARYVNYLLVIENKQRESGNLETLLTVRKERERFESDKVVKQEDLSADIAELRRIQEWYLKAISAVSVDRSKKVLVLAQEFDRSLDGLQQKLTREGKIDKALEVKETRNELKIRAEVTEANFILAEVAAKEANAAPPVAAAPATPHTTQKEDAKPTRKYTGIASDYIKKDKFPKLAQVLLRRDWISAAEYVEPDFVAKEGSDGVSKYFQDIFAFLRPEHDSTGIKIEAGDIKVDEKNNSATMAPRIWADKKWHEDPDIYWVRVDGDWYVDIQKDMKDGLEVRFIPETEQQVQDAPNAIRYNIENIRKAIRARKTRPSRRSR